MIENEQPEAAALKSGSSAPSVLGTRVPLWSLLLVAVVAAVVGIATYVLRDVPDLGAVGHSERVDMTLHLCNAEVDAHTINPRAAELDLVEVSPQADPPVVRVMDFGKFLFEQNKKSHAAKRKQKQIQIKEIKFRPGTDENDYQIKLRNIIRFLTEGDKAKVTLRFRGREMAHTELGRKLLDRLVSDLREHAQIEQNPLMEGRQMVMMFAPKKK